MKDEQPTIESIAAELAIDPEQEIDEAEEATQPTQPAEDEDESADGSEAEATDDDVEEDSGTTWGTALGIDDDSVVLDDDGKLTGIVVKVDGKVSTVEMKELIAGYQLNKHITQKSQAIAEERRQFEQEKSTVGLALKEKLEAAERLNGFLRKALTADYERVDWTRLRVENPGEYAAKMEEYRARQAQLDTIDNAVTGEAETLTEEQKRSQQIWLQNYLSEQKAILVASNKEWSDDSKFNAALAKLGEQAGAEYGITPQEFYELTDARYVKVLMDAIAFRTGKQAVAKKVMNVPKFQKPSTARPSQARKSADKELQLIKQARNSRKNEDKLAAATAILDNAFSR